MKLFITFFFSFVFIYANGQNFSWTAQTSGVSDHFRDVHFVDNQNGWAVGESGVIVHTNDGGLNWNLQTSNTTEVIRAVHFIDAANGWVSGGLSNAVLLKTTDSGSTWQSVAYPGIFSQLRDVRFADAMNGWLIDTRDIFHTTDGGTTWVLEGYASSVSGVSPKAIAVTSDTTAYVCGRYDRVTSTKAAVFDNIMQPQNPWTPDGVNSFDSGDLLRNIEFPDYYTGYAGGGKGNIYRMKSDSLFFNGPWENVFSVGTTSIIINSISFSSSRSGMFNFTTTVGGSNYSIVYHTNSFGDQWSSVPDSIKDLTTATVHSPDNMSAWMAGDFGKIYKGVRFSTGIENKIQNSLSFNIAPNPFSDEIVVRSEFPLNNATIEILDVLGKQVYYADNIILNTNYVVSGLNKLETGLYYLRISDNNSGLISTKKIIKN